MEPASAVSQQLTASQLRWKSAFACRRVAALPLVTMPDCPEPYALSCLRARSYMVEARGVLAQAERDHQHRRRLVTAAQAWLFRRQAADQLGEFTEAELPSAQSPLGTVLC
jgi:hypothetical protein